MVTNREPLRSSDVPAQTQTDKLCGKHGVPLMHNVIAGIVPALDYRYSYCPICEDEKAAAAREEEARERHAQLVAGIPPHYHGADLSQFDSALIAPAIAWAKNPRGFLYVTGDAGVGKTHLACAVKKSLNERGIRSQLVFSGEIFVALRTSYGKKSTDSEADVVSKCAPDNDRSPAIFDDVGAQKITETVVDTWFNIIDRRYRADAPTMITTNLSASEIAGPESLGVRVKSRICSGLFLELMGKDRRCKEHWTDRY